MAKKPTRHEAEQHNLIEPPTTPKWSVVSEPPDALGRQIHRLLYGKRRQGKGTTLAHLKRFQQIATFANERELAPRKSVQCRADQNLPAPPPRKKTLKSSPEDPQP